MAKANLNAARFHDEAEARKHLEKIRWPNGTVCPHCANTERISKLNGKSQRPGLYFCGKCREQFTVTVGTVFERSKIPLDKWLLATHLICSSKKGMSSHQLHRMLGVTYKTAWFMAHRIREAMKPGTDGKMGSGGGIVEVDETYWGNNERAKKNSADKMKVVTLIERDGKARSFKVGSVNSRTLGAILDKHVSKDAHLMTDELRVYKRPGREFASHGVVNHSAKEYARGAAHVNTTEGFFSLLKRGLVGTFHHVGEQHLQRYVTEFDFRWNSRKIEDSERGDSALAGVGGKRLLYRDPDPVSA